MQVIFIRHATAESASGGPDAARRLTPEGRKEAETTARALAKMDVRIELVLASPLVRAVETAEIVSRAHEKAQLRVVDFLVPPVDVKAVRKQLAALREQEMRVVAMVGHTPSLEECIGELVAGTRRLGLSLTRAGAACVEIPPDAPNGFELRWVLRRDQLEKLA